MSGREQQAPGWTAFEDEMPPANRRLLVTNNLLALDAHGEMSHLWLVHMVHTHPRRMEWRGRVEAEEGEITAFDDRDSRIRGLTHWRLALPDHDPEAAKRHEAEMRAFDARLREAGGLPPTTAGEA